MAYDKKPHLFTIYKSQPLTIRLWISHNELYLKCQVLDSRELIARLSYTKVERMTRWLNAYSNEAKKRQPTKSIPTSVYKDASHEKWIRLIDSGTPIAWTIYMIKKIGNKEYIARSDVKKLIILISLRSTSLLRNLRLSLKCLKW